MTRLVSCIIFYIIIEFILSDLVSLKYLYSCFLIFLILRGIILFLYNKRVFAHTAQNIKDILETNNYITIAQKYVNIFEYHFIFKKL